MKRTILLLSALATASCASMYSSDPNSLFFSVPEGSTLSLNKKLTISHLDTHAVIQRGKETTDKDKNDYEINCRLDLKEFGPRTIEPEVFKVKRTEDGQNWISQPSILRFYTEIYLSSDKGTDVIKMVCQEYGDQTDRSFTVEEIETALGDYFTFTFAEKK